MTKYHQTIEQYLGRKETPSERLRYLQGMVDRRQTITEAEAKELKRLKRK